MTKKKFSEAQCGKNGNLISHFFCKNFVKATVLLAAKEIAKKLIWRNIFCTLCEADRLIFSWNFTKNQISFCHYFDGGKKLRLDLVSLQSKGFATSLNSQKSLKKKEEAKREKNLLTLEAKCHCWFFIEILAISLRNSTKLRSDSSKRPTW